MRLKSLMSLAASVALLATGVALPTPGHASTYYFTQDGSSSFQLGGNLPAGTPPGYGKVDVTAVGSDLKFDVEMNANFLIDSGNATNHNPIEFKLATSGLTISSTPSIFTALASPFSQSSGSSFTNPGFNAPVNYSLKCPANGQNGCSDVSSLIFYVLGAGSLNPLLTTDGVYMTADIYGSVSGMTGTVGATLSTTPLPAALPLFATGLGLMGWLSRRRKQKELAAIAAA
jgi:hypothetical protein